MALTRAHHEGRLEFTRDDIIEAMTTVESGTAVGVEYVPEETRAVAIHEAGHAATAHVFMKGVESTRISIRMRAGSLGHHQALEKEERFSSWKHEEMAQARLDARRAGRGARLLRRERDRRRRRPPERDRPGGLDGRRLGHGPRQGRAERQGAYAGEERRGEGEGREALRGDRPPADEPRERRLPARRDRRRARRPDQARGSPRRSSARRTCNAYNLVLQNQQGASRRSPTRSSPGKELYGDELVELLNSVGAEGADVDLTKEEAWPTL